MRGCDACISFLCVLVTTATSPWEHTPRARLTLVGSFPGKRTVSTTTHFSDEAQEAGDRPRSRAWSAGGLGLRAPVILDAKALTLALGGRTRSRGRWQSRSLGLFRQELPPGQGQGQTGPGRVGPPAFMFPLGEQVWKLWFLGTPLPWPVFDCTPAHTQPSPEASFEVVAEIGTAEGEMPHTVVRLGLSVG